MIATGKKYRYRFVTEGKSILFKQILFSTNLVNNRVIVFENRQKIFQLHLHLQLSTFENFQLQLQLQQNRVINYNFVNYNYNFSETVWDPKILSNFFCQISNFFQILFPLYLLNFNISWV